MWKKIITRPCKLKQEHFRLSYSVVKGQVCWKRMLAHSMHFHVTLMWRALSCFPIWLMPRKPWGLQGQAGRSVWQKRRQYPSLKYFSCISTVWIPADETPRKPFSFFFNVAAPYFRNTNPFLRVSRILWWEWISVQDKCDGVRPCKNGNVRACQWCTAAIRGALRTKAAQTSMMS